MHQKEIDESVSDVVGGLIVGMIIAFGVIFRWPGRTLAAIAAGFVFFFFFSVDASGVDRYRGHASEVGNKEMAAQQAEQQKNWEIKLRLLTKGDEIAHKVNFPGWRYMSGLSDLERLEYLGNGRAKEFRAKYKLNAEDDPQVSWLNLSGEIEADIEDGDKQFSRTHSQVARVLEQLKPAERYLAEVAVNKDYFAGATTELRLSEAFKKEFDRQPDMVLKKPPVPLGARSAR